MDLKSLRAVDLAYRDVGLSVSSMIITSMKSTHGSVPFKHSVVRLYR